MSFQNLEAALQAAGNPVELLRNSQIGPYAFPVVRHEFTNWRDEQRSWRETCALFDQSHHMTDLYVEGPDALKLLSDLGVNSFKRFKVNQAKQFVACNDDGYVIGDAILFYLDENTFSLVGPSTGRQLGSVQRPDRGIQRRRSNATSDRRSIRAAGRSTAFRSRARTRAKVMENGHAPAHAGHPLLSHGRRSRSRADEVRALRHGMVGQPGWEIFGPWEARRAMSGRDRRGRAGVRNSTGRRANLSDELSRVRLDSVAASRRLHRRRDEGVPAVAERQRAMKPWRRSAAASTRTNIADYYLTPWDLGYGPFVKFDHDFVGRAALEKMAASTPHEGHAGLERRRRRAGLGIVVPRSRRHREVHRPAAGQLRDAAVRQGAERRQDRSASPPTPATTSTSARCSRWRSSTTSRASPARR